MCRGAAVDDLHSADNRNAKKRKRGKESRNRSIRSCWIRKVPRRDESIARAFNNSAHRALTTSFADPRRLRQLNHRDVLVDVLVKSRRDRAGSKGELDLHLGASDLVGDTDVAAHVNRAEPTHLLDQRLQAAGDQVLIHEELTAQLFELRSLPRAAAVDVPVFDGVCFP